MLEQLVLPGRPRNIFLKHAKRACFLGANGSWPGLLGPHGPCPAGRLWPGGEGVGRLVSGARSRHRCGRDGRCQRLSWRPPSPQAPPAAGRRAAGSPPVRRGAPCAVLSYSARDGSAPRRRALTPRSRGTRSGVRAACGRALAPLRGRAAAPSLTTPAVSPPRLPGVIAETPVAGERLCKHGVRSRK